jgi:hypothetical protein
MDDLQAWLAKGSQAENPLAKLQEEQRMREDIEALLRQSQQYRRICEIERNWPCNCGRTWPNGAKQTYCSSVHHKYPKEV